jgi:hypothetical protein
VNLPTLRHSIADRYPSAQPARDDADDSSGSRSGSGEPGDRRNADGLANWPRARSGLEQFHAAARARQSSRDADLADRGSAEEFAGELDDDHVLAQLASASWRSRAARHAEHWYPTGRRCAHQATPSSSRQGGHEGQADHLLASVLLPILLPNGPFRNYSLRPEPRSAGLSCENSRAGSQDPETCACRRCKRSEAIFPRS